MCRCEEYIASVLNSLPETELHKVKRAFCLSLSIRFLFHVHVCRHYEDTCICHMNKRLVFHHAIGLVGPKVIGSGSRE